MLKVVLGSKIWTINRSLLYSFKVSSKFIMKLKTYMGKQGS